MLHFVFTYSAVRCIFIVKPRRTIIAGQAPLWTRDDKRIIAFMGEGKVRIVAFFIKRNLEVTPTKRVVDHFLQECVIGTVREFPPIVHARKEQNNGTPCHQ